jgi:hypothetical protein
MRRGEAGEEVVLTHTRFWYFYKNTNILSFLKYLKP